MVPELLAAVWLLLVAAIDRRTGRIPNSLVVPAMVGTAAVAVCLPVVGASAAVAVVPYVLAFARGHCGGGDVKLAVPCGALVGEPIVSGLVVVAAAVISLVTCGIARKTSLPHGPALAASTILFLLLT